MSDPYAGATSAHNRVLSEDDTQASLNAMAAGHVTHRPDYELCHMRMHCLQLALTAPDGAPPPPLAEVIERARAYWAFVVK
jgi:hypothetical protein